MTDNELRTLANIHRRAETLFEDGYSYEPFVDCAWRFYVESPEGACYVVNVREETCTCDSFKNREYCKHLTGMQKELDRQEDAEQRAFDRWAEAMDAEDTRYGCDPYARY